PPHSQQELVFEEQMLLRRAGFYREEIDGLYWPAMNFALRNYQARSGIRPSGRFDVETLGSLGLLPEQRTTGIHRPHRRVWPAPPRVRGPEAPGYSPRRLRFG